MHADEHGGDNDYEHGHYGDHDHHRNDDGAGNDTIDYTGMHEHDCDEPAVLRPSLSTATASSTAAAVPMTAPARRLMERRV